MWFVVHSYVVLDPDLPLVPSAAIIPVVHLTWALWVPLLQLSVWFPINCRHTKESCIEATFFMTFYCLFRRLLDT